MGRTTIAIIVVVGFGAAGHVAADEPPGPNFAKHVLDAAFGEGWTPADGPAVLEAEGLVESERLKASGGELIKYEHSGFGTGGIDQFYDVAQITFVDASDTEQIWHIKRPLDYDEVKRRQMAGLGFPEGVTPDNLPDLYENYAIGALELGAALREQVPILGVLGGAGEYSALGGPLADAPDAPTLIPNLLSSVVVTGACGKSATGADSFSYELFGDEHIVDVDEAVPYVENSWLSLDPLTFMTGPACFAAYTAEVLRAPGLSDEQKNAVLAHNREQAAERVKLAGRDSVDGRTAFLLEMDDLGLTQVAEDGARYNLGKAQVWIDEEYFVRRKLLFTGTVEAEGQTRDFFMESSYQDYRNVPGSQLYEPYLTVLEVGGMMTPEQEKEMRAAAAQLEEFEREMASLTPEMRAMVERRMGSDGLKQKVAQMQYWSVGGIMRIEHVTENIVLNPDLGGAAGGAPELEGEDLVRDIQQGLTTLGYEPGPVTGQMNQPTAVAIVRFESERGMEITGQATPAVAAAIRAASR